MAPGWTFTIPGWTDEFPCDCACLQSGRGGRGRGLGGLAGRGLVEVVELVLAGALRVPRRQPLRSADLGEGLHVHVGVPVDLVEVGGVRLRLLLRALLLLGEPGELREGVA